METFVPPLHHKPTILLSFTHRSPAILLNTLDRSISRVVGCNVVVRAFSISVTWHPPSIFQSVHVHDMFTICSRYGHDMFTIWSRYVHDMVTICSLTILLPSLPASRAEAGTHRQYSNSDSAAIDWALHPHSWRIQPLSLPASRAEAVTHRQSSDSDSAAVDWALHLHPSMENPNHSTSSKVQYFQLSQSTGSLNDYILNLG